MNKHLPFFFFYFFAYIFKVNNIRSGFRKRILKRFQLRKEKSKFLKMARVGYATQSFGMFSHLFPLKKKNEINYKKNKKRKRKKVGNTPVALPNCKKKRKKYLYICTSTRVFCYADGIPLSGKRAL